MPTSDRLLLAAGVLLLAGCSTPADPPAGAPAPTERSSPSAQTTVGAEPVEEASLHSDGTPRRATLTIASIGVRDLAVVPYVGWTDDAPGTRIQNGGRAASPHGPRGGVGPGGIGNYQVTAHRLSSTRAFEHLPSVRRGERVHVEAGGVRYTYRIVGTRSTSFRQPASLRAQRAAVPGRPGDEPTRAMITLSTCATIEDHADGNWWADRFGNPEHRIDKIGVLVDSAPA
ncbi:MULTISPECIES: sortase domain-bontaining protein [unclassified Nocardioides]|uniref:sortase domain-containing protein n=1 Tax=unclassified Nocardioides TaxID=2615069 RepID=UPI00360E4291